jgi:hypothetical protein
VVGYTAALLLALAAISSPARVALETPVGEIEDEEAEIRGSIEAMLAPETGRAATRLPRVTIDMVGDVTVVFALQDADDVATLRQRAQADALAILGAVYGPSPSERITSVTVLGTYGVAEEGGRARERPVMRAVLSADRAVHLRARAAHADEIPGLVDVWWLHPALADRGQQ